MLLNTIIFYTILLFLSYNGYDYRTGGIYMRIAYLILAHKNPSQLKRLVDRISAEETSIFIHLDKKIKDTSEYDKIAAGKSNIHFISNRIPVHWGAFSMVRATLNSLQEIVNTGVQYEYISLLSGQDYPLKDNSFIKDYLSKNKGKEFLQHDVFPTGQLSGGGMNRVEYYYNFDRQNNFDYESEMKLRGIKRKFIEGMVPYHGSQWWTLTGACVNYILDQVKSNKEITNFYRYTMFSDEQFFQTIIMNSRFADGVINDNLRYIDWSNIIWKKNMWTSNPPHPKNLTMADLPVLSASPKFFARKFDESEDAEVLDKLDNILLH